MSNKDNVETVTTAEDEDVPVTEGEETLYHTVAALSDLTYDEEEYDSKEGYKAAVVRKFNKLEDDEFGALPADVQEWVNDTAKVMKGNKGAKRHRSLPALQGLDEAKEQKKRGRKASTKPKAEKPPKEKKPSRYLNVLRVLIKKPDTTAEELIGDFKLSPSWANYMIKSYESTLVAFRESGMLKE